MYNVNVGGDGMIDLSELNNHVTKEIVLDLKISFSNEELMHTDISSLEDVIVTGRIEKDNNDDTILDCKVEGVMTIPDAISLKPIQYPFHIQLERVPLKEILNQEENMEIDTNTLDLKEILWQNIVLEVPLKYTEVEDFSTFQGNGWKLISEEELKVKNNPFNDLKSKLGEE